MKTEDDGKVIANRKQIGAIFAVSDPMITRYLKQGMPKHGPAKYDVAQCVQWMIDQVQTKGSTGNEIAAAQMELNKARTQRVQIEIDKELGALISYEAARQSLLSLAAEFAGALDALPARTAPAAMAAGETLQEVQEVIRDECRTIRSDIAEQIEKLSDSLGRLADSGERDQAAAEEGRGDMGRREPATASG